MSRSIRFFGTCLRYAQPLHQRTDCDWKSYATVRGCACREEVPVFLTDAPSFGIWTNWCFENESFICLPNIVTWSRFWCAEIRRENQVSSSELNEFGWLRSVTYRWQLVVALRIELTPNLFCWTRFLHGAHHHKHLQMQIKSRINFDKTNSFLLFKRFSLLFELVQKSFESLIQRHFKRTFNKSIHWMFFLNRSFSDVIIAFFLVPVRYIIEKWKIGWKR